MRRSTEYRALRTINTTPSAYGECKGREDRMMLGSWLFVKNRFEKDVDRLIIQKLFEEKRQIVFKNFEFLYS